MSYHKRPVGIIAVASIYGIAIYGEAVMNDVLDPEPGRPVHEDGEGNEMGVQKSWTKCSKRAILVLGKGQNERGHRKRERFWRSSPPCIKDEESVGKRWAKQRAVPFSNWISLHVRVE